MTWKLSVLAYATRYFLPRSLEFWWYVNIATPSQVSSGIAKPPNSSRKNSVIPSLFNCKIRNGEICGTRCGSWTAGAGSDANEGEDALLRTGDDATDVPSSPPALMPFATGGCSTGPMTASSIFGLTSETTMFAFSSSIVMVVTVSRAPLRGVGGCRWAAAMVPLMAASL